MPFAAHLLKNGLLTLVSLDSEFGSPSLHLCLVNSNGKLQLSKLDWILTNLSKCQLTESLHALAAEFPLLHLLDCLEVALCKALVSFAVGVGLRCFVFQWIRDVLAHHCIQLRIHLQVAPVVIDFIVLVNAALSNLVHFVVGVLEDFFVNVFVNLHVLKLRVFWNDCIVCSIIDLFLVLSHLGLVLAFGLSDLHSVPLQLLVLGDVLSLRLLSLHLLLDSILLSLQTLKLAALKSDVNGDVVLLGFLTCDVLKGDFSANLVLLLGLLLCRSGFITLNTNRPFVHFNIII